MSIDPPPFTLCAEQKPGVYVIAIEGELDLGRCPDLDLALEDAERTRVDRIVLDLEGLTSIDSSGLETLLAASKRSADNGGRLQVTRGKGYTADMFRLTALDATLPLIDPALCPAIRTRRAPDDANRPRTGETFISRPAG